MVSFIKSDCGKITLEVEYDPAILNWNEAIRAAYAAHGFRLGQVQVIAYPRHYETAARPQTGEKKMLQM